MTLSADTRSIAVGDVDGDGALDVVYGIYNGRDRIVHNQGFNAGSSTYHMTSPAEVELNVGLLKYPSFQRTIRMPLMRRSIRMGRPGGKCLTPTRSPLRAHLP